MRLAKDMSDAYKDNEIIAKKIEVIRDSLGRLRASYKDKMKELELINESIAELKKQIMSVNNNKKYWLQIKKNIKLVDCIVNGVPIRIIPNYADGVTLISRFDDTSLTARVYTNGYNEKYYGLNISGCEDSKDSFRGMYWDNKDDCIESAKLWVASRKIPLLNGKRQKNKRKKKKHN